MKSRHAEEKIEMPKAPDLPAFIAAIDEYLRLEKL